jgi:hypothetical protein
MNLLSLDYDPIKHEQALLNRIIELEYSFMDGKSSDTYLEDIMSVEYMMLVAELVGLRRRNKENPNDTTE